MCVCVCMCVYVCMYLFFRLIRFNSRTRAIINAVAMVAPRIFHIAALMMSIFYAFAIIGMECFDGKVYQHCCKLVVHENFCVHLMQ